MALVRPGPPPFNDPPLNAAGVFNRSWMLWLQSLAVSGGGAVTGLAAETVARAAADTTLQSEITSLLSSVGTYVFNQASPLATWTIVHDLNRFPSATVVDSTGALVEGDVLYVDSNNITLSFAGAFSGIAYLN